MSDTTAPPLPAVIPVPDVPHTYLAASKASPGDFHTVTLHEGVKVTCSCIHGRFLEAERVKSSYSKVVCRHVRACVDYLRAEVRKQVGPSYTLVGAAGEYGGDSVERPFDDSTKCLVTGIPMYFCGCSAHWRKGEPGGDAIRTDDQLDALYGGPADDSDIAWEPTPEDRLRQEIDDAAEARQEAFEAACGEWL